MWLRRSSKQTNGSPASKLELREVADRPALLRTVSREHAERRPERRDDALDVQLRVLVMHAGSLKYCSLNNVGPLALCRDGRRQELSVRSRLS